MIQAIFRASGPPPAALVRAIATGSEGVPFYVEELTAALAAAGERPMSTGPGGAHLYLQTPMGACPYLGAHKRLSTSELRG